jgi:hypothetical protein
MKYFMCFEKKVFVILLIVFSMLLFGCTLGDTNVIGTDGFETEMIILHYQPMQCEQLPWAEYKTGTVTSEEAVQIWLEKNGVIDAKADEISNGIVCEACGVCPHYYRYAVVADIKYESKLRELGFGVLVE